MSNFAVIENELVINTIVAESLNDAQEVTGKTCVEYAEENPAAIGWTYDGTTFTAPTEG